MDGARSKEIVRFGRFEADLELRVLTKNGNRVRLQRQPFQVLAALLERPGVTLSREEISRTIWTGIAKAKVEDSLNTAVKKLRMALGDTAGNPLFVETVARRGYRFLAPISLARDRF